MWAVDDGGACVPGELFDVPLEVIRDSFMAVEPPELELGVIELADGSAALAVGCCDPRCTRAVRI